MTRPIAGPRRWRNLLYCLLAVAAIWLGVLPGLGRMPAIKQHLDFLREHHVDAGAMFYSELDPRLFPDPLQKYSHDSSHSSGQGNP